MSFLEKIDSQPKLLITFFKESDRTKLILFIILSIIIPSNIYSHALYIHLIIRYANTAVLIKSSNYNPRVCGSLL